MRSNKFLTLVVVVFITFGLVSLCLAEEQVIKGKVIKIEGNKLTIQDASGKEITLEVKNPERIRVKDRVEVKDGNVKRIWRAPKGC